MSAGSGAAAGLKSWLKHTRIVRRLRRRRFHAYSLGAPRTGTTSIAAMPERRYRAAHEQLHLGTMEHLGRLYDGAITREELDDYLRWRDVELFLEMESSHPLAPFAPYLTRLFPDARFVLGVREPHAWLRSIVLHPARFFHAHPDPAMRAGAKAYHPGEEALRDESGCTLDELLGGYAAHTRMVLDAVPDDRLLIVRTETLSASIPAIASFLGIPAAHFTPERSHENRAAGAAHIVDRVDPALVRTRVEEHWAPVAAELARRGLPDSAPHSAAAP